jgi:hypothetical protein
MLSKYQTTDCYASPLTVCAKYRRQLTINNVWKSYLFTHWNYACVILLTNCDKVYPIYQTELAVTVPAMNVLITITVWEIYHSNTKYNVQLIINMCWKKWSPMTVWTIQVSSHNYTQINTLQHHVFVGLYAIQQVSRFLTVQTRSWLRILSGYSVV